MGSCKKKMGKRNAIEIQKDESVDSDGDAPVTPNDSYPLQQPQNVEEKCSTTLTVCECVLNDSVCPQLDRQQKMELARATKKKKLEDDIIAVGITPYY